MRARMRRYWAEAVEPRLFLFAQLREVPAGLTAMIAVLNVVVGLLPVGFVVATSTVISRAPDAVSGGLGSPAWRELTYAFVVASVLFLLQQQLTPLSVSLGQRLKHQVDGRFQDRLMAASLRTAGITPLEDQASLSNLEQAAEGLEKGNRTPGDAAAGTLALVLRYSRLLGFLGVIGVAYAWWAAAAIGVVTMMFRYGQRGGVRMYTRLWPHRTRYRREAEYFRVLGMGAENAKEMRVFGLADWVGERYRSAALEALRPVWRERRRVSVVNFVWFTAASLVISFLVLASVLRAAAAGDLSLFALTLTLQALVAAVLLGEFYHEADTATQFGMLAARAMDTFERQVSDLADNERRTGRTGSPAPTDPGGLPTREIRFAGVSFTYPGASAPVFDGLDLTLRAGECTAIVGLNGAGKTTLVKLLSRLYDPPAGAVLVDGCDLRDLPIDGWRRQLAVIFQDFNRYELTAGENIAFGAVEAPATSDALRRAAKEAGVLEVLEGLPDGLDTLLTRRHADGEQLSGGQWQRLAIARSLYAVAAGARVLVLDEPTAALDVRAEAAFFDEFAALTRGITTLLISHRFATVRHADRIIVLSGGRIIEDGSHVELMAAAGTYAHLFDLQARRFAEDDAGAAVEVQP
ncbi:ABC transporter ATP-binding protein [Micromonospora sp. NPDC049891]|uniref:ABC transporter ATP-binding protein n=1 Tax=Micromonospora sp. NPDC049891 TaxID=3155655 RepID=UPI0033D1E084